MMKILLIALTLILSVASPAWAATYHVSKSGNNGVSCGMRTAFPSLATPPTRG